MFWLLFSLTESLLMRYHLTSYNWKPLICQSKNYDTERDNCTVLHIYGWYVNFFLFTLLILLFWLLFSLNKSLLMRYHLIFYNQKPLMCKLKTYETEMDNCTWLHIYRWYVDFFLFTLLILLFWLLFSLNKSLLIRYHLIFYSQKPLMCKLKTYETEMDNCTWLHIYWWYVNFFLFTLFIFCFDCYFPWRNLYWWDITWYPTTGNLWCVNQKPMRLRGTTVPDYIVIDDMLNFCCLPCLLCAIFTDLISTHEISPDTLWPKTFDLSIRNLPDWDGQLYLII